MRGNVRNELEIGRKEIAKRRECSRDDERRVNWRHAPCDQTMPTGSRPRRRRRLYTVAAPTSPQQENVFTRVYQERRKSRRNDKMMN